MYIFARTHYASTLTQIPVFVISLYVDRGLAQGGECSFGAFAYGFQLHRALRVGKDLLHLCACIRMWKEGVRMNKHTFTHTFTHTYLRLDRLLAIRQLAHLHESFADVGDQDVIEVFSTQVRVPSRS
jgi:hypothetical protein